MPKYRVFLDATLDMSRGIDIEAESPEAAEAAALEKIRASIYEQEIDQWNFSAHYVSEVEVSEVTLDD